MLLDRVRVETFPQPTIWPNKKIIATRWSGELPPKPAPRLAERRPPFVFGDNFVGATKDPFALGFFKFVLLRRRTESVLDIRRGTWTIRKNGRKSGERRKINSPGRN